ncbi:MAG: sulfite exporter TauE/SafE family protein [Gemmatimonas sp.]|jgi:uncharacterized membrane protein YfcA
MRPTTLPIREALIGAITLLALLFVTVAIRGWRSQRSSGGSSRPTIGQLLIGVVVNFFDTLGIGSLATTTTAFRTLHMVPDEQLPATMIVGLTLPVVTQALIFITTVQIDPVMLLLMIVAAFVGGWAGAAVVSRLPRRPIQQAMGTALLVAALVMALGQLGLMPTGGGALSLPPGRLALALSINVLFGALVMVGIGNYGPTFVLLSALGMDPRAAFPIMMGSGAFAALVGSMRFVRSGRVVWQPAIGLTLGGVPAVLVAALVVKSLPLDVMRWIVLAVVIYAAITMLRSPTPSGNQA